MTTLEIIFYTTGSLFFTYHVIGFVLHLYLSFTDPEYAEGTQGRLVIR